MFNMFLWIHDGPQSPQSGSTLEMSLTEESEPSFPMLLRFSIRLSAFAVGRGVEVALHDVYVVQLAKFP